MKGALVMKKPWNGQGMSNVVWGRRTSDDVAVAYYFSQRGEEGLPAGLENGMMLRCCHEAAEVYLRVPNF